MERLINKFWHILFFNNIELAIYKSMTVKQNLECKYTLHTNKKFWARSCVLFKYMFQNIHTKLKEHLEMDK
jgi:hypothetical protein